MLKQFTIFSLIFFLAILGCSKNIEWMDNMRLYKGDSEFFFYSISDSASVKFQKEKEFVEKYMAAFDFLEGDAAIVGFCYMEDEDTFHWSEQFEMYVGDIKKYRDAYFKLTEVKKKDRGRPYINISIGK